MTRSSNESKTSHAVDANLSKLELKKILIYKMESNKLIHRSDEQKNLHKALVDAYKSDKLILDTYGETVSFKRRRDEEDKDEEPSAGSNRGSKRRRTGKEPKSTSAPKEKTSKTTGKSTEGSKSHQKSIDEPVQHWLSSLAQVEDPRESFNELIDTPLDFSTFVMNRLKVDTLTPELLAGPTFKLMKGSCKSQQYPHDLRKPLPLIPNSRGRRVIPFDHFINNDLAYLSGGVSSRTYTTSVMKTKATDYGYIKWIEDLVPNTIWSQVLVSYDKHALWGISHWRQKRQQFYGFAANRSFIIQRRAEDLQLGVESYQKKLNLTKSDTYISDLKRREAYTAYSNPRGFIYQNKDKKNRLMCIDELQKFNDGTLNDVRTALNDRLNGIRIKYLPQTIWKQSDIDKAGAIIQAIDKQLKTRRIMRSLEKFIGGRPYEGDF
ncbi:hypothetical protein Tco_1364210 [Tanacetum coccineum]